MNFTGERFIPTSELLIDDIGYEHLHRYYSVAPLLKGKKVLDIACGEGYGAVAIARYASEVIGVDVDNEAIRLAIDKYGNQHSNVLFKQGEATKIPCKDNLFDVVVSFETIEHLSVSMQQQFMVEIKRVLHPDGVLIMSTPDKINYSERFDQNNPFHVHEFSKEEYVDFIKSHFDYLDIYDQGFEVVSIISNPSIENANSINIYNWQKQQNNISRKYMIAVASNSPLSNGYDAINSIVPNVNKDYLYLMERLVKMNLEIEGLGKWGNSLDRVIEQQESNIKLFTNEIKILKTNEKKITNEAEEIAVRLLEIKLQENEIEIQENEINALKNIIVDAGKKNDLLELQVYALEQQIDVLKQETEALKESFFVYSYKKVKKNFLSNDSPVSIKINKFFDQFKKNKKFAIVRQGVIEQSLKEEDKAKVERIEEGIPIPVETKEEIDYKQILVLPRYEHPLVSIVIPAYNGWEMNHTCIKSIINNTGMVAYEVILADDCSMDETKDCSGYIQNIVHIRNEENLGFLKNCNNAAESGKGKYILFLNNDTEVMPNWLSPLVDLIESDVTIGMVGSKLIYPDGRLQEAGGIIWKNASGWNYGNKQDPTAPEYNYVKEVDYISGACILLKKDLWISVGGFDTIYSPAYYEDVDIAFTLRKMGYKVMYQPLSQVIHHEGFSHGTEETLLTDNVSIKSAQSINKKIFYNKWKIELLQNHFRNAHNAFNARDRSLHRKTIVVIDHYVPHFDEDAGSKATFQYLELFVSLGLNVKFIGDNFFRHEPYTTALQQIGIEVLYGAWYRDNWKEWILENSGQLHYFYLNRPHVTDKYIDFIKENTYAKVLFMGIDLHFLREQRKYEIDKDVATLEAANKLKVVEMSIFSKSDVILTFSSVEKKVIESLDPAFNVATIPLYCLKENGTAISDFRNRRDLLFVGGFSHTPNADAVKWFCSEVWPLIVDKIKYVNFIVVGSNVPDEILALGNDRIQIKGFVTDGQLEDLYAGIKLVVVPLRYGAGIKGKTVGSMFKGIPIVSTSIGIEGMEGDYNHFLRPFNSAKSFAEEVVSLYMDEERQIKMSMEEVAYINRYFTADAAAIKMKAILGLDT